MSIDYNKGIDDADIDDLCYAIEQEERILAERKTSTYEYQIDDDQLM